VSFLSSNFTRTSWDSTFVLPGTYVYVDTTAGAVQPPPGTIVPLIMGSATGGPPNKVMTFIDANQAASVLRDGPLLTAVQRCFQPLAAQDRAPVLVRAIRVGTPTQSSLDLTVAGVKDVQTVSGTGVTAGTFTLGVSVNGGAVTQTGAAQYNTTASALAALITTAGLPCTATGGPLNTAPIVVTATNPGVVATFTVTPTGITGGTVSDAHTTVGSAATPVISLTSVDYGAYTNNIRIRVARSTQTNYGSKVTLERAAQLNTPPIEVNQDNVGRFSVNIQYIGSGSPALLTIGATAAGGSLGLATTVTGGAGTDNLSVQFGTYDTLQKVVDYINGNGAYVASVADYLATRPSKQMDYVTGLDITYPMSVSYLGTSATATAATITSTQGLKLTTTTTITGDNASLVLGSYTNIQALALALAGVGTVAAVTTTPAPTKTTFAGDKYSVVVPNGYLGLPTTNLNASPIVSGTPVQTNIKTAGTVAGSFTTTSHYQALLDFCNTALSPILSGVVSAANTVGNTLPDSMTLFAYLQGGTDGVETTGAWTNAFTLAGTADAQLVVPVTPDATIHAAAKAHCVAQSTPKARHERLAIVGGAAGETVTQTLGRALALGSLANGDSIQLVWSGLTDVDFNGILQTIPPYIVAAQMAGMTAALGTGKAKTHKFLRAVGVEYEANQTEQEQLVTGGVTYIEHVTNGTQVGFRVVKDITTWLLDNNYISHLFATKLASLMVGKRLREACDPYIGDSNNFLLEQRLYGIVGSCLNQLVAERILVPGPNGTDPWRKLNITSSTDVVDISVEASVTTEDDFIFVTAKLDVFRSDSF
jgi:hypothetical protein